MRHERLICSHSLSIAQGVLGVLANLIPDCDKRDAFEEIFTATHGKIVVAQPVCGSTPTDEKSSRLRLPFVQRMPTVQMSP